MSLGTMAFSTVSSGDSDIPSSSEMKDEPAFKTLQGSTTFFWVMLSWYPRHLIQQTQGPSHIPIAEGRLLFKCLWKVGLPVQSNTGRQLSPRDDSGWIELSSISCAEIGVPIDFRRVSQGISGVAKRKPSHLSCIMGNGALIWNQCRGINHHFKLIWATPSYFTFLQWHQCHSRLVRDFWGTL